MHFSVCDFLLDLIQNSIEAKSNNIQLRIIEDNEKMFVSVTDNGKGMDAEVLKKIKDPFYTDGQKHAKRKVGLGIPFLLHAVELAEGVCDISSVKGEGTCVSFSFPLSSIDAPPLGDLPGLILSAMCFDGDYELTVIRQNTASGIDYVLHRSEIAEAVGSFNDAGALLDLKDFLASQELASDEAATDKSTLLVNFL